MARDFKTTPTVNGVPVQLTGGGGALSIKEVEVDVGAIPTNDVEVVVVDATSTATSLVIGTVSYEQPTGKEADDVAADTYSVGADVSTAGQITFRLTCHTGLLHDRYKLNYVIG